MARFSEVVPTAGRYVNGADKAMLAADPEAEKADERSEAIAGPVALRLTRVQYQPRAQFGPRWLVECRTLATPATDVAIDFAAALKDGTVIESRMSMFAELRDRLEAGEAFEPVFLARIAPGKGGNPFWTFVDVPDGAPVVAPIWLDDEADEPEPEPARKPRLAKATARK